MSRKQVVRGGMRALTGAVIVAGSMLAVTAMGSAEIPEVRAEVPSFTMSTDSTSQNTIVCQGSFGVLGLNPASPKAVTPVGEATMSVSSESTDQVQLAQELPGATPPVAHTLPSSLAVRGAQSQRVELDTVRGTTASACGEPTNDQWLVGGSTVRGTSSVITLANPGRVPATVTLTVYDENGEVQDIGTTGVLIPATTQKAVPLNGFGAGRASTAVRVQTTGSPVFATLGVHQITDITPIGADTVNAQLGPDTQLVFPGVKAYENHTHDDTDGGHPVATVRTLAPTEATHVDIIGLTGSGERVALAEADLEAGKVLDTELMQLPDAVKAILIESEAPVVAGIMSITHDSADYDFTWMAPSAILDAGSSVQVVKLAGASVTVANLGETAASVTHGDDTTTIPAGGAKTVTADTVTEISADASFAVGATLFDERSLTTYPVLGSGKQIEGFTVFTR